MSQLDTEEILHSQSDIEEEYSQPHYISTGEESDTEEVLQKDSGDVVELQGHGSDMEEVPSQSQKGIGDIEKLSLKLAKDSDEDVKEWQEMKIAREREVVELQRHGSDMEQVSSQSQAQVGDVKKLSEALVKDSDEDFEDWEWMKMARENSRGVKRKLHFDSDHKQHKVDEPSSTVTYIDLTKREFLKTPERTNWSLQTETPDNSGSKMDNPGSSGLKMNRSNVTAEESQDVTTI